MSSLRSLRLEAQRGTKELLNKLRSIRDTNHTEAPPPQLDDQNKQLQQQLQRLESAVEKLSNDQRLLQQLQRIETVLDELVTEQRSLRLTHAQFERQILHRDIQNFENINKFLVLQLVMWLFMIVWFGFCYLSL